MKLLTLVVMITVTAAGHPTTPLHATYSTWIADITSLPPRTWPRPHWRAVQFVYALAHIFPTWPRPGTFCFRGSVYICGQEEKQRCISDNYRLNDSTQSAASKLNNLNYIEMNLSQPGLV